MGVKSEIRISKSETNPNTETRNGCKFAQAAETLVDHITKKFPVFAFFVLFVVKKTALPGVPKLDLGQKVDFRTLRRPTIGEMSLSGRSAARRFSNRGTAEAPLADHCHNHAAGDAPPTGDGTIVAVGTLR
jgi:hypothetical protein